MLPAFKYHIVKNAAEAVEVLVANRGKAKIIAGGTDLLLQMQKGTKIPRHLVNLRNDMSLKGLNLVDGKIFLGANTTHREVELSSVVKEKLGALHDAVCQVGSVQIRNVATIAGNICNASPAADTVGPLLALGATVRLLGPRGERNLALTDFFKGPGQTTLEPDEVLLQIIIPEHPTFSGSAYFKLCRRKALDVATIGTAVYLECTPDKRSIIDARIALTSVAPKSMRAYQAESFLKGAPFDEKVLFAAADLAANEASPRTDFRSTVEYRRDMLRVFVPRAFVKAFERI